MKVMLSASINTSLRLGADHTVIGYDDLNTSSLMPNPGDTILLVDPDTDARGRGKIVAVDPDEDLITIELDWKQFDERAEEGRQFDEANRRD